MAKKGTVPGLNAALKTVQGLGKSMNKEARADFGVAMSASRAGQANLLRQLGTSGRSLTRSLGRQQGKLTSLQAKARAAQQAVARGEQATINRYGQELGGAVHEAYGQARAYAAAGKAEVKAEVARGAANARVAGGIMGIAQQGAAAGASAAQYAMAQALQSRYAISAETVAQLTGQLYQSALQYNLEWQMWKKQQDYAEKKAGNGEKGTVTQLIEDGSKTAVDAAEAARSWVEENNGDISTLDVSAAIQTYAAENGYGPDDPRLAIFAETLRNMKRGQNAGAAWRSAIQTLYSNVPGFDRWGEAALAAGQSAFDTAVHAAYLLRQPDDDNPGGGGGGAGPGPSSGFGTGGFGYQSPLGAFGG